MPLFNGSIHRNPKKYSNPQILAQAIDMYISSVEESKIEYTKANGELVERWGKKASIPGLCLFLGMSSKAELLHLATNSNNPVLADIIKTTFMWFEAHYVEAAMEGGKGTAFYTFLLTNMGYKKGDEDKPLLPQSETVTTPGSSQSSTPTPAQGQQISNRFRVTFVKSKDSLPESVVREQLKSEGGGDTEIMQAIDEEYRLRNDGDSSSANMKSIEATVARQ